MDSKFLGLKTVISINIGIQFLLLASKSIIEPDMLMWAITAILLPFIAARTIEKRRNTDKKNVSIVQRLKAFKSREFLGVFLSTWGMTLLIYFGAISEKYVNTWYSATVIIAGFFNIGRAISKSVYDVKKH